MQMPAICPNSRRRWATLAQQVPEPTVHAVLRGGTHLADVKDMWRVIFEKSGRPDEFVGTAFRVALKNGICEDQLHGRLQAG